MTQPVKYHCIVSLFGDACLYSIKTVATNKRARTQFIHTDNADRNVVVKWI